jgi:CheY-like chemotaxis protein
MAPDIGKLQQADKPKMTCGTKVLLVDDDLKDLTYYLALLQACACEVVACASYHEALRCLDTSFQFPNSIDGVISTFALPLVPAFDEVIRDTAGCLASGKRMVILDFKVPLNWLARLAPLGVLLTKPFGVSIDLAARHPWESMARHFRKTSLTELYGGFAYIAVGEKDVLVPSECRTTVRRLVA